MIALLLGVLDVLSRHVCSLEVGILLHLDILFIGSACVVHVHNYGVVPNIIIDSIVMQ